MRAILLVLILAVVAVIAAFATGLVDVDTIRGARAPEVRAGSEGVTAKGGQAPAFEVETGSVAVGTREANVTVPKIRVEKDTATVAMPSIEVKRAEENGAAAAPAAAGE